MAPPFQSRQIRKGFDFVPQRFKHRVSSVTFPLRGGFCTMSKFIQLLVLAVFLYLPVAVQADPVVLINFDDPSPAPLQRYRSLGVEISTILLQPIDSRCPSLINHCMVVGTINDIALRTSASAVSPPQGAFPAAIDPGSNLIN